MTYTRLFYLLTVNHFRNHYIKVLLAIFGMATGIAIFVTTNIYKETIYKDVKEKEQVLSQSGQWIIKSSNGRMSEQTVKQIIDLRLFHDIAPKSTRLEYIEINGNSVLASFAGIDILSFSDNRFAENISDTEYSENTIPAFGSQYFELNEKVELKNKSIRSNLKILGKIPDSPGDSPLIVTDIALYQVLFSDRGWIDQLEVEIASEPGDVKRSLNDINPDLVLLSQEKNLSNKQSISDAFLVNLQFFSLISLIISILLIYQFYRFILMDREKDFAKLRAIGASAASLRSLLISEIIILGILSSLSGIMGGYIFSKYSLGIVTSTVSTFYFNVSVNEIFLSWNVIFISMALGIGGCLVSGIHPAFSLVRSSDPLRFLRYRKNGKRTSRYGMLFIAGIIILCTLFAILNLVPNMSRFMISIASVIVFTAGMSLTIPFIVNHLTSLISRITRIPPLKVRTAASYITRTLTRQSIFILSLAILVGFVISLIIFISSFRTTIENWIYQVTPADLYIQSEFNDLKTPFPLDPEIEQFIKSHPLVREYDTITRYQYEYMNIPVQIRASDFEIIEKKKRLKFKSLADDLSKIDSSWVLVSEPFSSRYGKKIGDNITITGNKQTRTLRVMGVFYDYVTERGAIYIDRELGRELFSKDTVNGISVYGLTGQERMSLEKDINSSFPAANLELENQEQIRENTLSLFDRTFRIVWLLAFLAFLISVVTILNATIMVYLERLYELIQLRALGASTKQLVSVVWSQISMLSVYTILFSFLFSAGFLNIIVKINEVFFGWTIDIKFDWKPYVLSILVLFILSRLAVNLTFSKLRRNIDLKNLGNE